MHPSPLLAGGLMFLAMFAGCASSPGGIEGPRAADLDPTARFSDDTGAIDGVVLDESLLPVEGADVSIPSLGQMAATAEDGSFVFSYVSPGRIVLAVGKPGFVGAAPEVDVTPGEVKRLQVVLREAASDQPYTLLAIKTGLLKCGVALVFTNTVCETDPYQAQISGSRYVCGWCQNVTVDKGHHGSIVEASWRQSGMLSPYVLLLSKDYPCSSTANCVGGQRPSSSPYRQIIQSAAPLAGAGMGGSAPDSDVPYNLLFSAWYSGIFQSEANATAGAACAEAWQRLIGQRRPCQGVGMATDLRYDLYFTTLMNGLPPGWQEISAIPDS